MNDLYRVCVKIYAPEPEGLADTEFVPIFHDWIRDQVLDLVPIDVADYAHAPAGPGIMLIAHEASFALDRADGRFGLLVQRRIPVEGGAAEAVAITLRQALTVAARLERDPRLAGRLRFDPSLVRVESNDRLRAPNSDAGFAAFESEARAAVLAVSDASDATVARVLNDPRDRLALEVQVAA